MKAVKIEETGLSERAKRELEEEGVQTLEELRDYSIEELRSMRFLSLRSVWEIKAYLEWEPAETAREERKPNEPAPAPGIGMTGIDRLGLSPRAYNALRLNGIKSVGQVSGMRVEELEKLPYMSPSAAREIYTCCRDLAEQGELPVEDEKKETPPEPESKVPEEPAAAEPAPEGRARTELPERPIPIEEIGMSVRSYNCLKRMKIDTLQMLLEKSAEELAQIRNLGTKSLTEILRKRESYIPPEKPEEKEAAPAEEETQAQEESPAEKAGEDTRPIEDLGLSVRSYNCLKNAGIDTVQQLMDISPEQLRKIRNLGKKSLDELTEIRAGYGLPVSFRKHLSQEKLQALLLRAFRAPFAGLSFREFRDAAPETVDDESLKKAIGDLIAQGKLEYVDFRCYRVYPSFYTYLKEYLNRVDERDRQIMSRRYAGETLESIAQVLGVTRERVRQLQKKLFHKLREAYRRETGYAAFDEDFYEALYTGCELPESFWKEELGLPESSVNYLEFTFRRGSKKPEEILTDEQIPVSLRYRVRSFLDRDKLRIDGVLVPCTRKELTDFALKKYAGNEIDYTEFTRLYNGMLEEAGRPFDEKLYFTEDNSHARMARMMESMNCLWKQGERLRYYDISGGDYTRLLEGLNLEGYQNTEVSTRKLMREYPELMEDYDLRDCYELHNLLKKIAGRCGLDYVNFVRQPTLRFGEFDKEKAVREVLFELAPVTQQELLEYLELEFGYDPVTTVGYLTRFSSYYHGGIYSVDFKRIPEERVETLREALREDFYYLDEARRLYCSLFPEADPEEMNPRTLKSLGFLVNSGYAVQHYPTAEAYFRKLLTKDELFDISDYLKRFGSVTMFNQVYAELLQSHQIFRFAPGKIVNLRRLQRLQVTEETIRDYCEAVSAFAEPDSYFTVKSLRRDGFRHALDELGFDDYFYASLLWMDERFSGQRVFGSIVVYNGKVFGQFSTADFLQAALREYDSVEPEDFMWDVEERFGVTIPNRYEVTAAVKDSELYYDSIMDKIYRDKALYYAELDD